MKRNYGIDLLKMLAMLMVVMLHIYGRGGVMEACAVNSHSLKYGISQLWYIWCTCSVDCFVLATGYIMSQHAFKYGRIFKLWGEVVFYYLAMTFVAAVFFPELHIGWRDWAMAVLPVATNRYWFFTEYVGLFLMIPFLNHWLRTLDRKQMAMLLVTGFGILSFYPSIVGSDLFVTHWGYSFLWFMYLYLLAGAIAMYKVCDKIKIRWAALAILISCGASLMLQIGAHKVGKALCIQGGGWTQYASVGVLLEAVAMLIFFSKLEIRNKVAQWAIGLIGPSVFSVYILHSNSVFRKMIQWNGKFASLAEGSAFLVPLKVLAIALLIFSICIIIDVIRKNCLRVIKQRSHHAN